MSRNDTEKASWDAFFAEHGVTPHSLAPTPRAFIESFEKEISPFYQGGYERGYLFRRAVEGLLSACAARGVDPASLKILEVGSGHGDLSIYLSLKGFDVTGVDLASSSKTVGERVAQKFGARCRFVTASIESTPFADATFDFVIGLASFHHFIKHPAGATELERIMKPGALGFFADPFHENPAYRLFHDTKEMARLGDELMTRKKIHDYFSGFDVELTPTDWFVMIDKLFLYALGSRRERLKEHLRAPSRVFFSLDRLVPTRSSVALFLSGGVVTKIVRRSDVAASLRPRIRDTPAP